MDGDRRLSYAELRQAAAKAARRLGALGAGRGSTVGLSLTPGLDCAIVLHALISLGARVEMLPPGAARSTDTQPSLVISDLSQLDGPEREVELLEAHDPAEVLFRMQTSGTSGKPKRVGLTYANFLWSAIGSAFNLGVDPADRWLCCLPLHHVAGLSILIRSAIYGTGALIQPRFDVERVAESLEAGQATVISLVATQLARLVRAGADLSSPRALLVGGGAVPQELLAEATGGGARVVQTYGMTETCAQVTALSPGEAKHRLGSAGRPLLGSRVRISVDGEILVAGPTVAPGSLSADGWLHSGDLGRLDDDGHLYVRDRISDTIVSGGENIAPSEVEVVLESHPEVLEAAVIGRPDPEWQEAVTAVIVSADGARPPGAEELRRHCAERLARHQVPKRFEFVGELPRSASGQLLRRMLRDRPVSPADP